MRKSPDDVGFSNLMKILHLAPVHARHDTRVFLKMCRGLAARGHEVILVTADGAGDEIKESVRIVDIGAAPGRLARMMKWPARAFEVAGAIGADLYHVHDPELLPGAVRLKRTGARVIFDSHEDIPADIASKPYLPAIARPPIAGVFDAYQHYALPKLDAVIGATPVITSKLRRMGCRAVNINNYPLLEELAAGLSSGTRKREIAYIGDITSIRGLRPLIAAMELTDAVRLNLGGTISEAGLYDDLAAAPGWTRTDFHGRMDRQAVKAALARSIAGVVTFMPAPNHLDAQPNKLFEYMSASLPVIASHFPLWKEIVEGNECGICVDPANPAAIATAINRLAANPDEVERMGENGRRAVVDRYNWEHEEQALLSLYAELTRSFPSIDK